jgi:acyl carrier protein
MEPLMKILTDLHPDVDFTANERLIDNKILDSFDIVTIIAEVDNAYDVAIPAEEIIPENFNSAASLYALIKRLNEED